MTWFGNLIGNLLSGDSSPDKILEVKLDRYLRKVVIIREDSVVLYDKSEPNDKYEILMHKPFSESLSQAFSLYRTGVRLDAERYFNLVKDKIPILCRLHSPGVAVLQKFCEAIKEHPSWNVCHLVVYFQLVDSIQDPVVSSLINASDPLTGVSPLQLAVKLNSQPIVSKLLQLGATLEHLDHDGNNILHYAANTCKEIIASLVKEKEGKVKCLNGRNLAGQTPLHVACFSNKPDCVKALLVAGADVNLAASQATPSSHQSPGVLGDFMNVYHHKLQPQEMKYGGTPLHWSSSKEVIDALLDCNCNVNAVNFDSRTALHVMVMKNRLECVVALLSREADPNVVDAEGNTPLHLAVKDRSLSIIQALIVFGSDLSLVNHCGESVRHLAGVESRDETVGRVLYTLHAVGATRCSQASNCGPGCTPGGTWDGIPVGNYTPYQRRVHEILESSLIDTTSAARGGRVLCLDGGGIRGLVLVVLLIHLEQAAGRPIVHCFDWVAATSTGAILALALAAGKTLQECLCLYMRMKDQAFAGFRPYNSEPLEAVLKENLGTETKMSQITHPKLLITACLADRKPIDLHIFRNYPSPDDILGTDQTGPLGLPPPLSPDKQLIWEAARASGAAPTYFRTFGRYVDGGLISNNPTLDALTEIHEYNTALEVTGRGSEVVKPSLVVSIGTGSVPITPKVPLDDAWEKTESGDDENFKTEIADTSTTTTSNKRQRTYSPDLQPSPCSMNQGNAERIDFFESEMSRVHNQSQGFEDQYDMFGRHVAGQLRELPLRSFVILQEKIQRLITKERLLSMGMEAL